jgi:hypothetical protein
VRPVADVAQLVRVHHGPYALHLALGHIDRGDGDDRAGGIVDDGARLTVDLHQVHRHLVGPEMSSDPGEELGHRLGTAHWCPDRRGFAAAIAIQGYVLGEQPGQAIGIPFSNAAKNLTRPPLQRDVARLRRATSLPSESTRPYRIRAARGDYAQPRGRSWGAS